MSNDYRQLILQLYYHVWVFLFIIIILVNSNNALQCDYNKEDNNKFLWYLKMETHRHSHFTFNFTVKHV